MLLHALCTEIGTRRQLCVPPGAAGHSPTPSPTSAPCRAESEGQRGAEGGHWGPGRNPPPLQTSTDNAALSIPFIGSFTDRRAQKGARGSLQPRGSRGGGVGEGGGRCSLSSRWGWGWARTPDPARPPASSTGSPTAQTLATTLLYPTHIDGHRGDRGGVGGGSGRPLSPGTGRGARSCPAPHGAERCRTGEG